MAGCVGAGINPPHKEIISRLKLIAVVFHVSSDPVNSITVIFIYNINTYNYVALKRVKNCSAFFFSYSRGFVWGTSAWLGGKKYLKCSR